MAALLPLRARTGMRFARFIKPGWAGGEDEYSASSCNRMT
ncbi:hypothetical protein C7S16_2827 [Burkholderia thailandensis]|uniref:Uncharacterized protein n=1 Tax=Burkholderia thailandensis TaxID=57975 RepID=A0AAW9CY13_BURTH|nr:hypothetical protein [Burkholderia thailandensis]MDW9255790.1 hypothetical protein [Burkholderia thailandensis]